MRINVHKNCSTDSINVQIIWVSVLLSTKPCFHNHRHKQLSKNTKNIRNPIPFWCKIKSPQQNHTKLKFPAIFPNRISSSLPTCPEGCNHTESRPCERKIYFCYYRPAKGISSILSYLHWTIIFSLRESFVCLISLTTI